MRLLLETLEEEKSADEKLTKLAKSQIAEEVKAAS
jgi:ferritin-like metal-binding protein YciE